MSVTSCHSDSHIIAIAFTTCTYNLQLKVTSYKSSMGLNERDCEKHRKSLNCFKFLNMHNNHLRVTVLGFFFSCATVINFKCKLHSLSMPLYSLLTAGNFKSNLINSVSLVF